MSTRSYPQKLREQIKRWQKRIDQSSEQLTQSRSQTRREFEEQIRDLKAKQTAARKKLEQIERSGKFLGDNTKKGVSAARHQVNRVVRKISSGFK